MTTAQMPSIPKSGGIGDIASLFSTLSPMFGSGKTTSTATTTGDPGANAQADELLKKIFADVNPDQIDAMVGNILERAKQTFGAQAGISANAAGIRAYSDTSLNSMRNEAMARATGEAAAAKLNALNAANKQAVDLVTTKMQTGRVSTQTQKTAASPAGKALSMLGVGAFGYNLLKKKGIFDKAEPPVDRSGSFDYGIDYTESPNDNAFSVGPDSGEMGAIDSNAFNAARAIDEESGLLAGSEVIEGISGDGGGNGGGGEETADVTSAADAANTAQGITAADVVTPLEMPPANPIDPTTGLPILPMPPAQGMMPGAVVDAEAIDGMDAVDALPADFGANLDIGNVGDLSAGMEIAGDASAEVGAEVALDFALPPGTFTIANALTGGELGQTVGSVADSVDSFISDVPVVGDVYDTIIQPFDDLAESIGSACFITTAATNGGELDNGYTLKTLREFRNTYMQTPERLGEMLDYYFLAPIIVKRINESVNADRIWQRIREDFLVPAVVSFKAGFPDATHEIYTTMMYWARQQAGLANPYREIA